MNIGWVSQALPYLPSRGGFRLYGGNLIRQLGSRHRIDLVSLSIEDDADHLDWSRSHCASVQTIEGSGHLLAGRIANALCGYFLGRPLQYRERLNNLVRNGVKERHWDIIHVEGGYVGGLVDPAVPVPKVLSLHDSWTLRCAEMLKCAQSFRETAYYKYLSVYEPRYERLVYPRYERCTVVAQPDVDAVKATVPEARVELIPYGTDSEYFRPLDVGKENNILVFHSHLGYPPNIESALELANEILPRVQKQIPQARLHLIGAAPAAKIIELARKPGIQLFADLPDLRAAVCSGNVYTSAIRYGTGLKSKILEAMAMRMPVVGYPGSAVGIACEHGRDILIAHNPDDFAAHVIRLLLDREAAERLARAGRNLVERAYSWQARAQMYEDVYRKVIAERNIRQQQGSKLVYAAPAQDAGSE